MLRVVVPLIKAENQLSTYGELVKCKHSLEVEIDMDQPVSCGSKNPKASFDLELFKEMKESSGEKEVNKY